MYLGGYCQFNTSFKSVKTGFDLYYVFPYYYLFVLFMPLFYIIFAFAISPLSVESNILFISIFNTRRDIAYNINTKHIRRPQIPRLIILIKKKKNHSEKLVSKDKIKLVFVS